MDIQAVRFNTQTNNKKIPFGQINRRALCEAELLFNIFGRKAVRIGEDIKPKDVPPADIAGQNEFFKCAYSHFLFGDRLEKEAK